MGAKVPSSHWGVGSGLRHPPGKDIFHLEKMNDDDFKQLYKRYWHFLQWLIILKPFFYDFVPLSSNMLTPAENASLMNKSSFPLIFMILLKIDYLDEDYCI